MLDNNDTIHSNTSIFDKIILYYIDLYWILFINKIRAWLPHASLVTYYLGLNLKTKVKSFVHKKEKHSTLKDVAVMINEGIEYAFK